MSMGSAGIQDRPIAETPIAVVDLETTGCHPGGDRIVELAVVRVAPGEEPELLLDTLVNPQRRVKGTEIHGIADEDVADAPSFPDIAGQLVEALADCAIAAHNVYFDVRFLEHEFGRAGLDHQAPHLCVMYLRPMLGLGARCSLHDVCTEFGIPQPAQHVAAADALAAAEVLRRYLDELQGRGIRTFGEMSGLKSYKFIESFARSPYCLDQARRFGRTGVTKTRYVAPDPQETAQGVPGFRNVLGEYWDVLAGVVSDLEITEDELAYVRAKQAELDLDPAQVRTIHARAYASVIAQFVSDEWIDQRECRKLHRLHRCLGQLGWAPGDPLPDSESHPVDDRSRVAFRSP